MAEMEIPGPGEIQEIKEKKIARRLSITRFFAMVPAEKVVCP
jgi:hypothetical protein